MFFSFFYIIFFVVIIVIILLILYLLSIKPNSYRKGLMDPFKNILIAHRGFFDNNENWPENTMAAFSRAVNAGYGIELDVQLTKDHKLVVFHDEDLKRMCGIDKKVSDCTYDQLQGDEYKIKDSDQTIPLFTDVLKLVNGSVPFVLEVKPHGEAVLAAQIMCDQLEDYKGIYCFESFNPLVLKYMRTRAPEIARGQLSVDFCRGNNKNDMNPLLKAVLAGLMCNFLSKPDFIAYKFQHVDQWSYKFMRRLYKTDHLAWTIKSREDLDYLQHEDSVFEIFVFDSFIPDESQAAFMRK